MTEWLFDIVEIDGQMYTKFEALGIDLNRWSWNQIQAAQAWLEARRPVELRALLLRAALEETAQW